MIENLHIQNAALIEEAEIQFGSGLNILSGETGAGKSILIDSINFLLGERLGKDFLRAGAEAALAEGLIRVTEEQNREAIRSMGVEIGEDDLLFLSRSMNAAGRSICRVNGRSVSIGMLREISALLVDIHGQHEHQSLLNPARHIDLLDRFCGAEIESDKNKLGDALREYRQMIKNIKAIAGDEKDRAARTEMLQYQIQEIESAKLSADEEENLNRRRSVLRAAEKLSHATSETLQWLQGRETEDGAVDVVGRAILSAREITALDRTQANVADQLKEIQEYLEEVIGTLLRYAEAVHGDPAELEETEERLDLIYRLKKKYGGSVQEILKHYARITAEMNFISDSQERLTELNRTKKELAARMLNLCGRISQARKDRAAEIQSEIEAALNDLGMKEARFIISVERKNEFSPSGYDKVEFLISPNKGEILKPLARIASGGEMSRVMLALKSVMTDADTIETFIFDEIDAGVSGRTAQQVAEKLTRLAKTRQILCITHLPQIAAMADNHYLIEKSSDENRTATNIYPLSRESMIAELARLIGGAKITDSTLQAAAEMKELAKPSVGVIL